MKKLLEFLDLLIGFRKFSIMLLLTLTSLTLLLFKILDGNNWVDLMKAVSIAYFASNSVEHLSQFAKDFIANKLKDL